MSAEARRLAAGTRAECRVMAALAVLPAPWRAFPAVEWRLLAGAAGEQVGEADMVVFHPHHGLIVFEVKAGAVSVRDGQWAYGSGGAMKQSPFAQARRNRFALVGKLRQRLGRDAADRLTVTHAVWFPDLVWRGPLPGTEAPSSAFLLDRRHLAAPLPALERIFREAAPRALAWDRVQQRALAELLAPDCGYLVVPEIFISSRNRPPSLLQAVSS